MVPELWYLNLVHELLGLGVLGYSDPLGLGVPDCLLGLRVLGVLGVLGTKSAWGARFGWADYFDLLGLGRLFRSIGIGPTISIYWDWAFPRRLFEGVALGT